MKKAKNFLSVFLAFLMIISIIPMSSITVSAEESATSGTCGENVTWSFDETTGTLTISGTGVMYSYRQNNRPWESNKDNIENVVINNGVTSIGSSAFYNCANLESITIPDSITSIGGSTFSGCTSLTSVIIPDSVTSIGYYAFSGCTSLTNVTIPDSVTSISHSAFSGCTSLTSITIPDSVTSIGSSAFYSCDSLKNISVDVNNQYYSSDEYGVLFNKDKTTLIQYPAGNTRTSYTIPDSVTSISYSAFRDCTSLKSVTIPDSVTSIGSSAFYNCKGLTSVTIPDSVTSIGYSAFENCIGLTSVTIPDSVISIGSSAFNNSAYYNNTSNWEDNVLYIGNHLIKAKTSISGNYEIKSGTVTIADSAFSGCTSLTSVTIPDSVTSIGSSAFYNCANLEIITIPDSVTSIGGSAFSGCTSLTSVTIPDSVTSIGSSAFNDCTSLESVTISDSVTSIDDYTFYNCSSLKELTMPASAKIYNSEHTFYNCTNIEKITLTKGTGVMQDYYYSNFWGSNYIYTPWYISGCTEIIIEDGVTTIGDYVFYNCANLESITIPDSVISIGNDAFNNSAYYNNTSNWEDNVLYIGNHLIKAKTSISGNYEIKNGTITIANAAFYGCEYLSSITFPDSLKSIGSSAFYDCTKLKALNITDLSAWCKIDFSGAHSNPLYCGADLYLNGSKITNLVIPDGITNLDSYLFYGCDSITSVTIPDSVTSIGGSAFENCIGLTSVTIPDSVTSIGGSAFEDCKGLKSVTIPDSVTSIGGSAFYDCTNLNTVNITDISAWCNIDFEFGSCPLYYGADLYLNGEKVTDLIIPDSVTSIGNSAFENCTSLTSVTIPDSVTSIAAAPFEGCTNLKNISVDVNNQYYSSDEYGVLFNKDKTTLIQYPAGNTRTSYTIPDSVTSIPYGAFYGCTGLTSVTIPDSVTSIGGSAFEDCKGLKSVTIPDSVTSIGGSAFYNCKGLTSVIIPDSVTSIGYSAFYNCYNIDEVFYSGSEFEWAQINFNEGNSNLRNARIHYNYDPNTHTTSAVITAPTCTVRGYTTFTCVCGYTYNGDYVSALGHTYESVVTAPTCTAKGYTTYTCHCGYTYEGDYLNALGHTYESVVTAPTCTVKGYTTYTCYCGNKYVDNYVDANGHNYINGFCSVCDSRDPDYSFVISIQTPSTTTIRHKDGIKLHAKIEGDAPAGSYVVWTASNNNFKTEEINNGNSLQIISDKNGYTTFTATLYSVNGEILDTETIEMRSKAGFFDKLGSFFRSIFGGTTIYEY